MTIVTFKIKGKKREYAITFNQPFLLKTDKPYVLAHLKKYFGDHKFKITSGLI